ncbi:hypothetical protein [Sphingobacterium sp.]|uniref:hypothetical protein n=1 Tax=Sphingobacterium sp. TaxID=341027 RepID=UPI0031DF7D15
MYNYSTEDSLFVQIEIKKIKKARNNAIAFIMVIFLIYAVILLYVFSDRWLNAPDKLDFYHNPPLFLYTLLLFPTILFTGLSWALFIKNQKYINALQQLGSHDLNIYRRYTRVLAQRYMPIAPYIFCKNELIFFPLFASKKIPVNQIRRIETKYVRNYRSTYSFHIYFYNDSTKIYQVAMNQIAAFDFLQKQLLEENPNLTITARNQIPSYLRTKYGPTHD